MLQLRGRRRGPRRTPTAEGRGRHGAAVRHSRRHQSRGPLGEPRDAVTHPRGLAGEHDPSARPQHATELGEGPLQSGRWWSTACPSTRSKLGVRERQRFGVGAGRRGLPQAQPVRVLGQTAHHAGRDVGAGRLPQKSRLHQVETEIARCRRRSPGLDRNRRPARSPAPCGACSTPGPDPIGPKSMPHLASYVEAATSW